MQSTEKKKIKSVWIGGEKYQGFLFLFLFFSLTGKVFIRRFAKPNPKNNKFNFTIQSSLFQGRERKDRKERKHEREREWKKERNRKIVSLSSATLTSAPCYLISWTGVRKVSNVSPLLREHFVTIRPPSNGFANSTRKVLFRTSGPGFAIHARNPSGQGVV